MGKWWDIFHYQKVIVRSLTDWERYDFLFLKHVVIGDDDGCHSDSLKRVPLEHCISEKLGTFICFLHSEEVEYNHFLLWIKIPYENSCHSNSYYYYWNISGTSSSLLSKITVLLTNQNIEFQHNVLLTLKTMFWRTQLEFK